MSINTLSSSIVTSPLIINPHHKPFTSGHAEEVFVTQDNIMSTRYITHIIERLRLTTDGVKRVGRMNVCPDDRNCQIVIVARLVRH